MKAIVGIGSGGHARVVLDAVRLRGEFEVVGLLDKDPRRHDQVVDGVRILGGDELLPKLFDRGVQIAFLGVGGVGDNRPRARIFESVLGVGFHFATIVHPSAVVASSVELGEGVAILAGAILNSGARLGQNVIVNTGAVVDHDAVLGDHVHVAPGAVLSGGVCIGSYTHVGTGACVRQNVTVGSRAVIGVGAAVVSNVTDGDTVAGIPARVLLARRAK